MPHQSVSDGEISVLAPLAARQSHSNHVSFKSPSMIEQFKTKVIRKRTTKQDSLDALARPKLKRMSSIDLDNGQEDSVVPNRKASDGSLPQVIEERSIVIPRSKPKAIKATKSLPPMEHSLSNANNKKRRQTIRRTGFRIRDNDFQTIFSDLPAEEQLVIGYSCAWRKDVFLHGRLFLSMHHLCFYTCFFKWEESICLSYDDIVSVTREKSVKLVPNAIKIRTKSEEQYLFVSHLPRERIFISIFRLWQNALLKEPMDYNQIRATIIADESTGESESSLHLENTFDQSNDSNAFSQSLPIELNTSPSMHDTSARIDNPTTTSHRRLTSSFPTTPDQQIYQKTCPCPNHLAKIYADHSFTFNVDTLYELIFGDNAFTQSFHRAQNFSDYQIGSWQINAETNKRERIVTYKTLTHSILGTNTLTCEEKQIFDVEKEHSVYVVSTEVRNEGMKYTDAFYVATRFCMTQCDAAHCSLKISAEIRYLKQVNGFIKSFIEKNAHSSIENGIKDQIRRLESQQISHVSRSSVVKPSKSTRKPKKIVDKTEEESSVNSMTLAESYARNTLTGRGVFYDIGLFVGIFFIFLHLYLCYKLYSIDRILSSSSSTTTTIDHRLTNCFENNPKSNW